jgi:pyruvate formate lyase activating enzyme
MPFMTGMIFDIQKFSIHDGPGIRTTVFFKGCPLRCCWCHNPESNLMARQLSFNPDRCIGCGYCFERCPNTAHKMAAETHVIERGVCKVCGACTETCYAEALEMVGREATVDEVIAEVLKDKPFYETSGGGMTLSGGEPLMQIDFADALLCRAKAEELHTCIETSGYCDWEDLERIRPKVDLFLYDVKALDPDKHREFTGVPNQGILDNLRRLHETEADIVVRLPVIPGLNDTDDHFQGVATLARELTNVQGFEIMPYHRLGEGKLGRLGLEGRGRAESETPSPETVNAWIDRLAELDVNVLNEKQT